MTPPGPKIRSPERKPETAGALITLKAPAAPPTTIYCAVFAPTLFIYFVNTDRAKIVAVNTVRPSVQLLNPLKTARKRPLKFNEICWRE